MDDVITLYGADGWQIDAVGNQVPKRSPREVYARIESVGRSEYYAAAAAGLRPEIKAVICRYDFDGETEAELGGKRYAVIRTYAAIDSDRVELYLGERGGVYDGKP